MPKVSVQFSELFPMASISDELKTEIESYGTFSFKLEWTLKKQAIDQLFKNREEHITSDAITRSFLDSYWHLELWHTSEVSDTLQIYLHLDKAGIELSRMCAKTKFIIKSNKSEPHADYIKKREEWRDDYSEGYGFKKWITKEEIYKGKYWQNGVLSITCEVDVKITEDGKSNELQTNESYTLEPLAVSYAKLVNSGLYSDVTIKIRDKCFKAHRNILATRCEYFGRMFGSDFKESKSTEIELKDIEPDIFEYLLEFIYTNRIPENLKQIATDLLVAAHMLNLQVLTKVCESKLCKNISKQNCLDLLAFADLYNQTKLKKEVVMFLVVNLKDIRGSESWKLFKKNHLDLVVDVLEISTEFLELRLHSTSIQKNSSSSSSNSTSSLC